MFFGVREELRTDGSRPINYLNYLNYCIECHDLPGTVTAKAMRLYPFITIETVKGGNSNAITAKQRHLD